MDDLPSLIKDYLLSGQTHMMQLATSVGGQPWCCTVYYAADDNLNLIWASLPPRRHSQEVAKNPNVAGVVVYDQQPPQPSVRGIQFEGTARQLQGNEEAAACQLYVQHLKRPDPLLDDIRSGKNPHKIYQVDVSKYVLFDSTHFPKNPRQEWTR